MPTADRYSKYRADQTTIWVSKTAAGLLNRERDGGESSSAVLDRMLGELRKLRRAAGIPEGGAPRAAKTATKAAAKSAGKAAAKGGAAKGGAAKGAAKSAGKAGRAAGKSAAKGGAKAAGRKAAR